VLGKFEAIFDTGTTLIIGDPDGISVFYAALLPFGALPAPELGDGIYTSTWAVVLVISHRTTFDFPITVPCTFNTTISVYVGGRGFKIAPATFNLGPVSEGSDTCIAGAASNVIVVELGIVGLR